MSTQCLGTSGARKPSQVLSKAILFVAVVLGYHSAWSQDALNELTVDRPGIAEAPYTVAPGTYQFEIGFDYFKRYNGHIYNVPTVLFRTGVSQRAELRISSKQIVEKADSNAFLGVSPVSIGVKMHIFRQRNRIPEIDIMTNVIVPTTHSPVLANKVGYEVLLLFQNDFYPNMAVNYNVGYIWDNYRGKPMFTASFCFNYLPTSKVGLFAEYFSFVPDQSPGELGLDGGMTYLLRPNLQLDLSAGISRMETHNNVFVSSGFTFRIY